jgi:hypothetical protein
MGRWNYETRENNETRENPKTFRVFLYFRVFRSSCPAEFRLEIETEPELKLAGIRRRRET